MIINLIAINLVPLSILGSWIRPSFLIMGFHSHLSYRKANMHQHSINSAVAVARNRLKQPKYVRQMNKTKLETCWLVTCVVSLDVLAYTKLQLSGEIRP